MKGDEFVIRALGVIWLLTVIILMGWLFMFRAYP